MKKALIIIGCTLMLVTGCNKPEEVVKEPVIRPVRIQQVLATGGKRTRAFSGSARAGQESKLSFRISGTLQELSVKLGDSVQKGQAIAKLDPRDFQLQVEEALAGLQQSEAQARNAAANYERIRELYENNNVSINDLDAARASTESASAQVESIKKRLELARSQLSYTSLTAPVSGYIALVQAEENENVGAGQAIAVLNAGARPETTFLVPEQLITDIREGAQAKVRFDAIPGQEFPATITEVGVATGGVATAFPVTARLDAPNGDIRQGMAAEIFLVFGQSSTESKILIKPKAVVEDRQGKFVYVAQPTQDGLAKVVRKPVVTGDLTNEGLVIQSGLTDGEHLITAGIRFLKPDMIVKLPADEQE